MEIIRRKYGGEIKEYKIYSKEEFEKLDIPYKYWKDGWPEDWVITDDNIVSMVIARKAYDRYKSNNIYRRELVQLPIGSYFVDNRRAIRNDRNKRKSHVFTLKERKVITRLFALMILSGTIDWRLLGRAYNVHDKMPEAAVKRKLRSKEVQAMVNKELEKILEERGVSTNRIIDMYNEAFEVAKEDRDPNAMIKVAENFAKIKELFPKTGTQPFMQLQKYAEYREIMSSEDMKKLEGELAELSSPEVLEITSDEDIVLAKASDNGRE